MINTFLTFTLTKKPNKHQGALLLISAGPAWAAFSFVRALHAAAAAGAAAGAGAGAAAGAAPGDGAVAAAAAAAVFSSLGALP